MSEFAPGTASSLLLRGQVASQTSFTGAGAPDLHPEVLRFFEELPAELREPFIGCCAESALVSDQLWFLDKSRDDGGRTTLDEAVPYFSGAFMISKKIRERGDPEHGETALVCRSCTALLEKLEVEILED